MSVNLSNFECIYTSKEYDKIFNKIKKKIITDNKKSKKPICRIFTGPPGSGKSRMANKYKNNIDVDTIVNELNESKDLKKLNVKHGNVIDSCIDIATRIGDDLTNICIYKKYNFIMEKNHFKNLIFSKNCASMGSLVNLQGNPLKPSFWKKSEIL